MTGETTTPGFPSVPAPLVFKMFWALWKQPGLLQAESQPCPWGAYSLDERTPRTKESGDSGQYIRATLRTK